MHSSSSTARTVLRGTWLTACDPRTAGRVTPQMAAFTEAAVVAVDGRRAAERLRRPVWRAAARIAERLVLPGACTHYVERKNAIYGIALDAPVEQIVVLGAGLDGLAWRMAGARPDVRCVEVDHPATQDQKRLVLEGLQARRVELVAADFAREGEMARAIRERPRVPTLFVAEGLTMYLSEAGVRELCEGIAARGDRGAVTFMTLDRQGRPNFCGGRTLVGRYLRWAREPFTWGVSVNEAAGWFEERGVRTTRVLGASASGVEVEVREGMICGEWLAVLEARSFGPRVASACHERAPRVEWSHGESNPDLLNAIQPSSR